MFDLNVFILIDCCIEWTIALSILFPLLLNHGIHCGSWQEWEYRSSWFCCCLIPLLCRLEHRQPSGTAVLSFVTRSSRSSYMDEDCDSLALCDPVQRINCDIDSLPESCFDSGLSTLRDSNEYDSEVEYKHQRGFQRSHGTQDRKSVV